MSDALDVNCFIQVSGGEPTLNKSFEKLMQYLNERLIRTYIPTNATLFSTEIKEALDKKIATVVVSVDSGTNETYKKMHGYDYFNAVWRNIHRYSEANGDLILKYIVTDTNHEKHDIDVFLMMAANAKIKKIHISIELFYQNGFLRKNKEEIFKMAAYLYHQRINYNFDIGFTEIMPSHEKSEIIAIEQSLSKDAILSTYCS